MNKINKNMSDHELEAKWNQYDFKHAEETLFQIQQEIATLASTKNRRGISLAQAKLVNSLDVRMTAVKRVCDRVLMPGIDHVKWQTGTEKMRAALSLNEYSYKARPMRLIVIRHKGAKERHIQIPTVFDRAMQVLYSFALDPVSETTADKGSFACRKGRSLRDLHAHLMRALDPKQENGPPIYAIKTDIKMCYASISHIWLLKYIPMHTHILEQFLKAGHIFKGEFFPPTEDEMGIPIGASISPIIANMTLDGIQRAIFCGLHGTTHNIDYTDGYSVRFADDILVLVKSFENVARTLVALEEFLKPRGLKLSAEKTSITDLRTDGFDFLSRNYRCCGDYVDATPSEAAISKIENNLRDYIGSYTGGQKNLIDTLNQKLSGWANYHRITDATKAFERIDTSVTAFLLELCEKLHPQTPRAKLTNKYFYRTMTGYSYALADKPDVRVFSLANDFNLLLYRPLILKMNPYLDAKYFEDLREEKQIANFAGKYKKIWLRQNERCYYCGKPILIDEMKYVIPLYPGLSDSAKYSIYVHEYCVHGQAEFHENAFEFSCRFDLFKFLENIATGNLTLSLRCNKYVALMDFFQKQDSDVVTLTFSEIEHILGHTLCVSALTTTSFWSHPRVCSCWRQNGYRLKELSIPKQFITVRRFAPLKGEVINIPDFLYRRMPKNAKVEIEMFLHHVKRMYGL